MDKTEGIMARFRTMAVSPSSILAGHVLGSVIQSLLAMATILAVATAIGFRAATDPLGWLALIGILALTAFAMTWLTVAMGLVSSSVETASNLPSFLLILPFQSRFSDLDPALVWLYLGALVMGTLSTALVVAPVAAHRLLFRHHLKGTVVKSGDLMAKAGLVCLALAVVQVLALVIGFVLGTSPGFIAGGVTLAMFGVLWLVVPLHLARAGARRTD